MNKWSLLYEQKGGLDLMVNHKINILMLKLSNILILI